MCLNPVVSWRLCLCIVCSCLYIVINLSYAWCNPYERMKIILIVNWMMNERLLFREIVHFVDLTSLFLLVNRLMIPYCLSHIFYDCCRHSKNKTWWKSKLISNVPILPVFGIKCNWGKVRMRQQKAHELWPLIFTFSH